MTENKPKCLLTVGGRTILDSIIAKIDRIQDCDEILIVTNSRFYEQMNTWKKTASSKHPIRILNDRTTSNDDRLGAIGDLGLALNKTGTASDVMMLASDNLFDQDLNAFVRFAQSKKGEVSTAVYDIQDPQLAAKKYGVFETDAAGKVLSIEEKPERPKTSLIGMGVYYFPGATLPRVAEYLADKNAKDAPGYYLQWLFKRSTIFSFTFQGMWYDIGDLQALEEANRLFKTQK